MTKFQKTGDPRGTPNDQFFLNVVLFRVSYPVGTGLLVHLHNSGSADICGSPGRGQGGRSAQTQMLLDPPRSYQWGRLCAPREQMPSPGNLTGVWETRAGFPRRPERPAPTRPWTGQGASSAKHRPIIMTPAEAPGTGRLGYHHPHPRCSRDKQIYKISIKKSTQPNSDRLS